MITQRRQFLHGCVFVCNSVIRLFDKIFRSKHELILEKYFNVFEEVFEKSNNLRKYLNTNTNSFHYGKLKYKYNTNT